MLIGMFHKRKDPRRVSRAYLYSAIAKVEGIDFFYFTASNVDFEKREITGRYYCKGKWKTKVFPFPDAIINSANQDSKLQDQTEKFLKKIIPFTSFPVGTKSAVYQKVINGERFKAHIIPYQEFKNNHEFFDFIKAHGKTIVKPVRGHHGDDVISIEKKNFSYLVHIKDKTYFFTKKKLLEYLDELIKKRPMLLQKFIDCRLKTGEPYDFRLHLQKNRKGKWVITTVFPRVGTADRVITNLSQGSQMVELPKFLKREFGVDANNIKKQLIKFSLNFVIHFESLYPYEFDELAIDVGLDRERHIWIYEVNWRPGHVFIEVQTAKNAIGYAVYLAENKEKHEKTVTEGN